MSDMPYWRNHIGAERAARGLTREQMAERSGIDLRLYTEIEEGRLLPRFEEFQRIRANLDDIDPMRLYAGSPVGVIGRRSAQKDNADFRFFYEEMAESSHLLVAPDEVLWLDRVSTPGREVDVFFNMSCSTQFVPHLMLDSAAVLQTLGVSFASGSGAKFCCGTYYRSTDKYDRADRMNANNVARAISWGADTAVHMCTQCVNMYTSIARRQEFETGESQGLRHVQLLRFVDELLAEMGDSVPWQKEVDAKVLVHGHQTISHVHDIAKRDVGKIAARIPGVEVVGDLDRIFLDDFCIGATTRTQTTEEGVTIGGSYLPRPRARAEVKQYRNELAEIAESWGADTISTQHQTCLQMWEPFSSERVQVRHVMSLLAEALGVGHPDRYLAASRLGDIEAIVEQTRPIWTAWGMSEQLAYEKTVRMFDASYQTVGVCDCGKGPGERCGHPDSDLITIDVLKGAV
jgi:Fe-S oxidoreductase/DNA-binding XRE family transcriptional regulator